MSKSKLNSIRESICATCLSQDRQLYPAGDSDHFTIVFHDVFLSQNDNLCWECRHIVRKMAVFRSRALRAQAILADFLDGKHPDIKSLSRLSSSEPTIDTCRSDGDVETEIYHQLELVKEEVTETPNSDVAVKYEEYSGDEMGDEDICEEEMVDKEIGDKEISDDNNIEVCGAETLIDILKKQKSSKSTTPIIMPTLYVQKEPKVSEIEDKNSNFTCSNTITNKEIPISYVQEDPKEKDILEVFNPDFTYSDVMTKEEIRDWRKRKEKMEFYTSSVLKCEKCIEPFENITFYKNHKKRHTQMYGEVACDICEMRVGDTAALAYHMKSQHRLLKCNYCGHEWDNPNAMRRHCGTAHAVPVARWTCDQCDREFGSWQKLSEHARRHRVRECPECGQLLRSSLERHMLSLHADLPSRRCAVCGAECKGDSWLKVHMQKHEKRDDTSYCAECNSHFRSKCVYRSHLRNSHRHVASEELRYQCSECDKAFLNQYSLTNHVDAVHDKQEKYPCERCGEAFRTVIARKRHGRSAHAGHAPRRDKVCDHCGKAFTTKSFLAQHMNSHTGARPHRCGLCGAAFGFKSALYTHARLRHKLNKKT